MSKGNSDNPINDFKGCGSDLRFGVDSMKAAKECTAEGKTLHGRSRVVYKRRHDWALLAHF